MANQFIARKGLIALSDSEITGSLSTTSNLNIGGQTKIYNRNFIIGTQVTASNFPGVFEFGDGSISGYHSHLIFRPRGNAGGYNQAYWGSIGWDPNVLQGLQINTGNYKTSIWFTQGVPGASNPNVYARFDSTTGNLKLQKTYRSSYTNAEEKLHVVGNIKTTGFVTASTYYGDGSNLTGIDSGSWDGIFTGSAVISGSLDTKGGVTITGSNALAGNYVLKVTNTSGDNILNVENDGNVGIGINNPSTMLDMGTIDNPAAVTIRGKGNSSNSADYPKIILDGEWHGSADKMEINVGETTQYGGTIRSNDIALKNGNNINARFNGTPSLPVNFSGNVVDFGGGILGTGRTLKIAENIQTYQHTGFVYDWLEWTGGSYGGQGYTFHTYTHKNLLALDGSTGRVGIGTSSPSAMLHVTGAIYTESNITASGHVSASTYYGDGSNLTGVDVFPYTGSAIITGSLQVIGDTNFDGILDLNNGSSSPIIGPNAGGGGTSVSVGSQAGRFQTGNANVSIGGEAMKGVDGSSTVNSNVAVGHRALRDNTTGGENTAVGNSALQNVSAGSRDTAVGFNAGMTGGGGSVYVGSRSSGAYAYGVAIGYYANFRGGGGIAIGRGASAGTDGQVIGQSANGGNDTIVIGRSAGNQNSNNSVYLGRSTGVNATGNNNIAIGYEAGRSFTTATGNVYIGREAGELTTGSNNVYIGYQAGQSSQGTGNIFIGKEAGESVQGSNKLYIDNSNTSTPLIYGEFDNNKVLINGELSASSAISASTYYGDGSNLTGISSNPFPYTGSAVISGSLEVIGNVTGSLTVESSGSTVFEVIGSEGQLFSITDSLSGSLFAVSDVSGLPILEVFSDDTVKIGSFNNEAIIVTGSTTQIKASEQVSSGLSSVGDYGAGAEITYLGSSATATTIGKIYYYTGTTWAAFSTATESHQQALLGIALGSTMASGFLLKGFIYPSGASITAGRQVYGATNASITGTAPTSGYKRVMGHSISTTVIYFNPSQEYTTL